MSEQRWEGRNVVGVDIGGANLKYCSTTGVSLSKAFPMWQRSESLADALRVDLAQFGSIDALAITMTGELADCFVDREQGVHKIVDQVMAIAMSADIHPVRFYGVGGEFLTAAESKSQVDVVAAANWHALANYVASRFPAATTLVDIGSTTTDIIPLSGGQIATDAKSDFDRLVEGSLVYVGGQRTPVCALVDELQFAGTRCRVMNEVFATIDDARILTLASSEDELDCDTPDHRPRTRPFAANRLARMIGLDQRTVSVDQAIELAEQVIRSARERIDRALREVHRDGLVVVAGHATDLLAIDSTPSCESLPSLLGREVSRCAPAFAVAQLLVADSDRLQVQCDAS